MNKRSMTIACSSLLVGVALVGAIHADDLEPIRELIAEASAGLTEATLKNDGEVMLSFYTEDAISLPNYSPMLRGKDAIRAHGQEMEKMGFQFKAMDFVFTDLWSCDDLVYEVGNYEISFCMGDTTRVMNDTGKYLTIWEKQPGGTLKIKVETWNTDKFPGM